MKPTVLFLFNSSDYAVRPWINDGRFNVVSVDYDDTDHSGAHRTPYEGHTVLNLDLSLAYPAGRVCEALEELGCAMPSLVIAFPPCTDLAVSGAKHFASKLERDPQCQLNSAEMARIASRFGCAYAVENPVSVLATLWRKPDHKFHPWEYSAYVPVDQLEHPEFPDHIAPRDMYPKLTCLWTGGGR